MAALGGRLQENFRFLIQEDGYRSNKNLTLGGAANTDLSASSGTLVFPKGAVGFTTGSGGAVTQATNRSTGVTLNKTNGQITTNNTSLAAGAEATFTVTNNQVAIGDVVNTAIQGGQTAGTSFAYVSAVAAGSFDITVSNLHASTADTGAMIINFAVIKAVAA